MSDLLSITKKLHTALAIYNGAGHALGWNTVKAESLLDESKRVIEAADVSTYTKEDLDRAFSAGFAEGERSVIEAQNHVATLVEHYAFTDGIVRFDGAENMEQLPVGTKFYANTPVKAEHISTLSPKDA